MERSERRHRNEVIKARVRNRALNVNHMDREWVTPRWVGRTASIHWTCDCLTCKKARMYDAREQRQRERLIWEHLQSDG